MANDVHRLTEPTCRPRNRRQQYIINPGFQWKYAGLIAVAVFLLSTVIGFALYGVLHHQARLRAMHPDTYTADVTLVMLVFSAAFSLVTATGVGVWAVVMTHRICGPLFVVERYLRQLAGGRIPEPRPLRRKDEFQGFYATFHDAMASLRQRRRQEQEGLAGALVLVRSAREADGAVRDEVLEALADRLDGLRDAVGESTGEEVDDACVAPGVSDMSPADCPVGAS